MQYYGFAERFRYRYLDGLCTDKGITKQRNFLCNKAMDLLLLDHHSFLSVLLILLP